MLCGTKSDKVHVWWIIVTEFFVFGLVIFVAADFDDCFVSKAVNLHIIGNGLKVLVLMPTVWPIEKII